MKKIILISLISLFTAIGFAHDKDIPHYVNMENSAGLVNPDGFFEYTILKGDYLWMLADKFYNNPYKWTDINKANPYIVDPNWIYPNNWLVIPNVFTDDCGKPIYQGSAFNDAGANVSAEITGVAIDLDGDGIVDGVDIDGDGVIDANAGIDLDGDGVIDGYDVDGDGNIDILAGATLAAAYGIDLDGDGIVDGVDIDGDGIIDANAGIDLDGDGVIDGYDIDGDGEIDMKSSAALAAAYAIDLDGDGIVDGVDIDGDGVIDTNAGIDIDGDGVIDGYDVDDDGNMDILAGAAVAATTTVAVDKSLDDGDNDTKKSCVDSYCGKPGWKLGIHAGYPVGGGPEDANLNLGLLLGTPLGVKVGPLSVGLGAGAFTYDFENFYFGGGLLASLCINDLFKLDIPLILQLHGIGFYIFGEEQGLGVGAIGSGSVPLGKSPISLGLYGALGKYYPNENDYNWSNVGAVLFYNF